MSVSAAKDKGEKKLFGFSFTPLMREDGTTLSDDSHELYVYKVTFRRTVGVNIWKNGRRMEVITRKKIKRTKE